MALYKYVSIRNMVEAGGKIYANNTVTNDIVVLNKETFAITDVIDVHLEKVVQTACRGYFMYIIASSRALFLFPAEYSGYAVRYDLNTKETTYKRMKEWYNAERSYLPYQYCQIEDKVYFAPEKLEMPFGVFDLEEESFSEISLISSEVCETYKFDTKLHAHSMCIIGDEMLLCNVEERVISISIKTKQIKEYYLQKKSKESLNIFDATEDGIWYIGEEEKELCCLNRKDGSIKTYEIDSNVKVWGIVATKDKVLLYANGDFEPGKMYLLDLKTGQILNLKSTPVWHRHQDFRKLGFWNYFGYIKNENSIILIPEASDMLLKVDLTECSVMGAVMCLDERFSGYIENAILKEFFECGPFLEEEGFGLQEMLSGVQSGFFVKRT